jgi:hypothetical protein
MTDAGLTIDQVRASLLAERHLAMDDLLSRWHHWLHPLTVSRGHSSSAAGAELYRASRQYDDENGALDDAIEHRVMQGVQGCHERLEHPHSTAITIEARNLHLGLAVFRSPRLPDDPAALAALRVEARRRMLLQLLRAGLVD